MQATRAKLQSSRAVDHVVEMGLKIQKSSDATTRPQARPTEAILRLLSL
jgi:hypothetical protein